MKPTYLLLFVVFVLFGNSSYAQSTDECERSRIRVIYDLSHENVTGGYDGAINLRPYGGLSPYSCEWTGPNGFTSTDEDLMNITAGIYRVKIKDRRGCESTYSYEIRTTNTDNGGGGTGNDCGRIRLIFRVTSETVTNAKDGAIDISPYGGQAPYSCAWSGPDGYTANTEDLSNLKGGKYQVRVTDRNGCEGFFTYNVRTVKEEDVCRNSYVELDVRRITHESYEGAKDGKIDIQLLKGKAPFFYTWTGPDGYKSYSQDPTRMKGGEYKLVIRDANNCEHEFMFEILTKDGRNLKPCDSQRILAYPMIINPTYIGASDGSISVDVFGGNAPYVYIWTGPDGYTFLGKDATGMKAGTYILRVFDLNGCRAYFTYYMTDPPRTPNARSAYQDAAREISFYPNPTDGILKLRLPDGQAAEVDIFDASGKSVFQKKIEGGYEVEVNLTNQEAGLYLIRTVIDGNVKTSKFILR
ncbi:T9SS type A sorting domain-containing protein [Limibacter armeniacum]|uniref:T9SS type A sorting domain-containing protein n=1 Tax=Limibacter armeniacum TaxID=466084 RepID=UPI002FE50F99